MEKPMSEIKKASERNDLSTNGENTSEDNT
jgi:hypothetical protein